MIRFAIGIVAAGVIALSVLLWRQQATNAGLEHELIAAQQSSASNSIISTPDAQPNDAAATATQTASAQLPAGSLQQIEDEILAAAEFAVPLTSEQQERVRLDTIIRKGELDGEYAMLFRQLNLPPHALDALKILLVERHQAIYDARQLAIEEGLELASAAEERAVENSALGEIDGRIAALVGTDGYAKLREHVDLAFYRRLAEIARQGPTSRWNGADDERVRDLARRLHAAAPDYEEKVFQANGWDVSEPPAVRELLAALPSEDPQTAVMAADDPMRQIRRRMQEIARDALLEGRISMNQLSGQVSREYQAELERRKAASAP